MRLLLLLLLLLLPAPPPTPSGGENGDARQPATRLEGAPRQACDLRQQLHDDDVRRKWRRRRRSAARLNRAAAEVGRGRRWGAANCDVGKVHRLPDADAGATRAHMLAEEQHVVA
jgi:hypothetical protein